MMRMGLIAVGLSTLIVMELGTPSSTKTSAPDPFDQLTINVSVSPDTLETADRLETHHLQHKVPFQAISPVEAPPQPPAVTDSVQEDSSTAGLSANDEKDVVKMPKPRPKYTDSRPKHPNSNKSPKTERSKAIVEIKQCRSNALDGLLKALNLSSRCQT